MIDENTVISKDSGVSKELIFVDNSKDEDGEGSTTKERYNADFPVDSKASEEKVLTHGYVHGHIHFHGDHTHIHGHFHNHDHEPSDPKQRISQEKVDQQVASRTDLNFLRSCEELDEFTFCNEVLCDDLDDCFFKNCDSAMESKIEFSETDQDFCFPDCKEISENGGTECNKQDCENPKCIAMSKILANTSKAPLPVTAKKEESFELGLGGSSQNYYAHQDSLCSTQASKRPIFENLINQVHRSFDASGDMKRQKVQDTPQNPHFHIHFPHECHPCIDDSLLETIPNRDAVDYDIDTMDSHQIHQSCFHTTIPEIDNSNIGVKPGQGVSDYDFYVQFDNFKELFESKKITEESDKSNEDVRSSFSTMFLEPEKRNALYPCMWNNCQQKVSENSILKHLIKEHIEDEYRDFLQSGNASISPRVLQCEWNNCDFVDSDINSLIKHLDTHKNYDPNNNYNAFSIITPSPTDNSAESSPNNSATNFSVLNNKEKNFKNDVNITSMRVYPQSKKNGKSTASGANEECVCMWDIGVDEAGKPIPCSKHFKNEGDMHNHLLNDHIGSGKSLYNCRWIGCDRHNGKCFPQRQKLVRHIHIHTNYKPCKCQICGAAFAVDSMLQQHLRTHSGEKPFSCGICGKKFATASSLSIHNRVHTGEKPLVCKWPGCGKRFSESSNLTKHMKVHTKSYECSVCGLEFDKKLLYTKHLKTHK